LTAHVAKSRTCLVFINQIREKIGVMFGNPETTTGGRALKFYSSIRIDIRRIGAIKEGEETVGSRTKLKVVKNKVAVPFRAAEFDIMYGEGISKTGDLIDLGVTHKLLEKSGSWISYGDTRIGQGRENAKQFLRNNPDMMAEIDAKLRSALNLPAPAPAIGSGDAAAKPAASPGAQGIAPPEARGPALAGRVKPAPRTA
jgi:recombination protein RecA